MSTTLYLRATTGNGIGSTYLDMLAAAGAGASTCIVNTAASGTEIQWTVSGGGAVRQWISGRTPAGGFTLVGQMTFSIWAQESNMSANCGIRVRVFKRTAAGVETEIGSGWAYGSPTELSYSGATEYVWTSIPATTAFAENDRILIKAYIINVGTMASGYTCTLTYDATGGSTGDSLFTINETVAFKAEFSVYTYSGSGGAQSAGAADKSKTKVPSISGGAQSGGAAAKSRTKAFIAAGGAVAAGAAITLFCHSFTYVASGGGQSGGAASIARTKACTPSGGGQSGGTASLARTRAYAASGGAQSGGAAALARTKACTPSGGAQSGGAAVTEYAGAGAQVYTYVGTGGSQSGGAADKSRSKVPSISGGAQSGGAATRSRTKVFSPAGGGQSGGAATVSRTKSFSASGGAQSGGAAIAEYIPAGGQVYVYAGSGGGQSAGAAGLSRTRSWMASGGATAGGTATHAQGVFAPAPPGRRIAMNKDSRQVRAQRETRRGRV